MRDVRVQTVRVSGNSKTGPIPVTATSSNSCPTTCPFQGQGCYAESGPSGLNWRKIDAGERGSDWADLIEFVRSLRRGQVWRHNQAGDLPHTDGVIDADMVGELAEQNRGRRGFTYTHHDPTLGTNAETVRSANEAGFTINLSGNNPAHADELVDLGIGPVVTVLPKDAPPVTHTPAGRRVIVCPAVQRDDVTCADCKLCANPRRQILIGFPVHGSRPRVAARAVGLE